MLALAGVTFGRLPDEEAAFLAFLRKTGDVWARAVDDDPVSPRYEPLPVAEFLEAHAGRIVSHFSVAVYLGFREDIFTPAISVQVVIEGGTEVPFLQSGKIVKAVHTIVGGKEVHRKYIDPNASPYIRYNRGEFRSKVELSASNLGYGPGAFRGETWVSKTQDFLKWGKRVLAWMRRSTPEMVRVYRSNYKMRATLAVAEACRKGLYLR